MSKAVLHQRVFPAPGGRSLCLFWALRALFALAASATLWFYSLGPSLWLDRFDSPDGFGAEASGFGLFAIAVTCLLGTALQVLLFQARTVYVTGAISLLQLVLLFRFVRRTGPVSLFGLTLRLPIAPFWYHAALLIFGLALTLYEVGRGPDAIRQAARALCRRHRTGLFFFSRILLSLAAVAVFLLYLSGAFNLHGFFLRRDGFSVVLTRLLALLTAALGLVLLVLTLLRRRTLHVTSLMVLVQMVFLVLWAKLLGTVPLLQAGFPAGRGTYVWASAVLLVLSLTLAFHEQGRIPSSTAAPHLPAAEQDRPSP